MSLAAVIKSTFRAEMKIARRQGLAADWTAGANFNIFNVDGMVIVWQFWGHVTTVIGAGVAVPQVVHTPTLSGAAVPLSAAHAGINASAVDTIFVNIGGALGTALTSGPAIGAVDTAGTGWAGSVIILAPGIVSIVNAVASTGIVDWYFLYSPCTENAGMTAL
jgi:hypothetical protein